MKSIRILHASDLHIAQYKNHSHRSPLDRLGDIDIGKNRSWKNIVDTLKTPYDFYKAWWKRLSASSYEPEVLELLAEYIYNNTKKWRDSEGKLFENPQGTLDAVILTGDLATTGEKEDILQTQRFLTGTPNPKFPHKSIDGDRIGTLAAIGIDVISLPGNHDRLLPTFEFENSVPKFFNVGGENFDDELVDYRKKPVMDYHLSVTFGGQTLKVLILAADCTLRHFSDHQGLLCWIAQGKVYDNTLLNLKRDSLSFINNRKKNEILSIIWACHFPPGYPGMKSHSKLIGEEDIIKAANDIRIVDNMNIPITIIAGHTHKQLMYKIPSMLNEAYCCGTTTQYEPLSKINQRYAGNKDLGNLFQIIEVSIDNNLNQSRIDVENYRYSSVGIYTGGGNNANELRWQRIS